LKPNILGRRFKPSKKRKNSFEGRKEGLPPKGLGNSKLVNTQRIRSGTPRDQAASAAPQREGGPGRQVHTHLSVNVVHPSSLGWDGSRDRGKKGVLLSGKKKKPTKKTNKKA